MQVPEFNIIDIDKIKSGQDYLYLYSDMTIPNNHSLIGNVVDMPISYWGQNHGNWWTDTHYKKGLS